VVDSNVDWNAVLAQAKASQESAKSQLPKACSCGGSFRYETQYHATDADDCCYDLYLYRCVKCGKEHKLSIPLGKASERY
jgi:hypothetical protein